MRHLGTITIASIAAATIACGRDSGHKSGGGGAAAAGGAPFTSVVRTTLTGCLQTDDTGAYVLRTTDGEDPRETVGTTGPKPEKAPGSSFRTTGQGGDLVANSPRIGSQVWIGKMYIVAPGDGSLDLIRHVGKRVSIAGVVQGGAVVRATSITTLADDCPMQSPER